MKVVIDQREPNDGNEERSFFIRLVPESVSEVAELEAPHELHLRPDRYERIVGGAVEFGEQHYVVTFKKKRC